MKKKFFFAAVALVMSAATAVGYKAYDKGNMSEFMMANIEALTTDESGASILLHCADVIPYTNCFYVCDCGKSYIPASIRGKLDLLLGNCSCGKSAHL